MRFTLLDRILEIEPGKRITAIKTLSLAEEYLADHFPTAPVMPGVLMLEGLVQASAWLIRASEDFAHSIVTLKQARGVKFANFVNPGGMLTISSEITDEDGRETRLKAQGIVDGAVAVSAKLVLERFNLSERGSGDAAVDTFMVARQKELLTLLHRP